MKQKLINLLIVSGTGRNSGKTTIACELIHRIAKETIITSIKISPHVHTTAEMTKLIHDGVNFRIYQDIDLNPNKDTGRMLLAGSKMSYYIEARDSFVAEAFLKLYEMLKPGSPIICESPALYKFIKPAVFIIADSQIVSNKKADVQVQLQNADMIIDIHEKNWQDGLEEIVFHKTGWQVSFKNK
ncbi:MAG TPA: hypothetical protein PK904_01775 [Bacteroidales bacterium]|nr:hypothetical protein [Bacteroidales bacterium]